MHTWSGIQKSVIQNLNWKFELNYQIYYIKKDIILKIKQAFEALSMLPTLCRRSDFHASIEAQDALWIILKSW